MKVLLLQARYADDPVKAEEVASFAKRSGLPESAFTPHDLLEGPPTLADIRKFDALMVGGSGDYYISKGNLPHIERTCDFLRDLVAIGHPTFASCFGFHLLTAALGGEITYDPDNMELGTYDINLTPDGQQDELLGVMPSSFRAQLGHKDRTTKLPPGLTHLSFSQQAPFQALRIPGEPIWATQFHPELTGEENRARYLRYAENYSAVLSDEERDRVLDRFTDSPYTPLLIPRFLSLIAE